MHNTFKTVTTAVKNTLGKREIAVTSKYAKYKRNEITGIELSKNERAMYENDFKVADKDKDGLLKPDDVRSFLKTFHMAKLKDEDVNILFDLQGANQNGVPLDKHMDVLEFIKASIFFYRHALDYTIKQMDSNADGKLTKDEIKQLGDLLIYGRQAPAIDQAMGKYDKDGDGQLSYQEVKEFVWSDISPFTKNN